MCIGLPMQVVQSLPGTAWVRGMGREQQVDMSLVGEQPEGTWLLVFLDAAREVIDESHAHRVAAALEALQRAAAGDTDLDHLFADLVGREPELPEFLRPIPPTGATGEDAA